MRIRTLQRQARELGRFRAGYSIPQEGKRNRAVRSKFWIVTSPSRRYVESAATLWGGDVEQWQPQGNGAPQFRVMTQVDTIDALLPPGDPLFQANEMWSAGGCQRRCDGELEMRSGKPCLCQDEFGDEWFKQRPDRICRLTTRLNLIVPDLPDIGTWRMETHGFYAANELAATVDMILLATGGAVAVPVRLRIEPRTQITDGKTKQFPVVVLELRNATAGQLLSGSVPGMVSLGSSDATSSRQALPSSESSALLTDTAGRQVYYDDLGECQPSAGSSVKPGPSTETWLKMINACKTKTQINELRDEMKSVGLVDERVKNAWRAKAKAILEADERERRHGASGVNGFHAPIETVDGESEPDKDVLWTSILAAAKPLGWKTDDVIARYTRHMGHDPRDTSKADGFMYQQFLVDMKEGRVG